jgi:hypothetical protein
MAAFNFEVFEAEFKQKRLLQDVADLFGELRDPDDPQQRLLPVEPGTPLHNFMQKLRTEATPAPNFDFELGEPITVEQAANRCAERRLNGARAPVNLPDMLVTAGQRLFFNTAMQQPATYVEISRPEASDLPSEVAACHFLDGAKKIIDWAHSLPSLKRLAQERLYTETMARHALHRLVSIYTPEHSHLVSDMTANEMANYLLSTETNRDKTAYRRKELFELTRKPDMDLRAPLTTARRLIDMIFPANRPEMAMQRSAAWRTAIISFLPDEIAVPISDRLKIANEKCRPISDEELEAMAYQAEEAYKRPLTFPLKYNRNVGSLPATSMIQFNSMQIGNAAIPTHGIPAYGDEQFSVPLMAGSNPTVDWQEATQQQQQRIALQEATRLQQQIAAQQEAKQHQQQRTAQQKATQLQEQSQSIELHSVNLQAAQNDRLSQIESQIELLAVTVKEGMAAAKSLSRKGASRESSQTRARNPSRESEKTRTESYKRGEVREDRYSSKERRDCSASRLHSEKGRSFSTSGQRGREQSKSPYRQQGSSTFTSERKSRRDDRSGSRGRERSIMARQTYPKMRKGENCSLDYDPLKTKSCSKCGKPGHHEFECYKYERYSIKKCSVCDRLHHFAGDCKELEKFPPNGKELNSSELIKNW